MSHSLPTRNAEHCAEVLSSALESELEVQRRALMKQNRKRNTDVAIWSGFAGARTTPRKTP